MRKLIILAASLVALAALALPTAAMAKEKEKERVQCDTTRTATFTVTRPAGEVGNWSNLWTHNYDVTVNADGSFTGTGHVSGHDQNGAYEGDETITGTFGNATVTFTTSYEYGGQMWHLSLTDAPTDGDAVSMATVSPGVGWLVEMKVTPPVYTGGDVYKNHGDYVSSNGGGADAAHSNCGMPVNSNKNKTN